MKILNLNNGDYHIHSIFSPDALNTIDEIVQYAGKIGLKEIAITEHSQATVEYFRKKHNVYFSSFRGNINRWKNVYNDVNVIFGIEGDLLNKDGDVCFDIQGKESDFLILSAHKSVFDGKSETVNIGFENAIKKYHEKIKFIAHPCSNSNFGEVIDIVRLVKLANKYKIPLEFNATYFAQRKTNLEKLDYLLKNANEVYLNTDAHAICEMNNRELAIKFLKNNKYI